MPAGKPTARCSRTSTPRRTCSARSASSAAACSVSRTRSSVPAGRRPAVGGDLLGLAHHRPQGRFLRLRRGAQIGGRAGAELHLPQPGAGIQEPAHEIGCVAGHPVHDPRGDARLRQLRGRSGLGALALAAKLLRGGGSLPDERVQVGAVEPVLHIRQVGSHTPNATRARSVADGLP